MKILYSGSRPLTPPEKLIEVVKEVYARYRLGNLGVLKLVLDWIETVRPRL